MTSDADRDVSSDCDVWERVWNEEEKANSASTPMFCVKAVK